MASTLKRTGQWREARDTLDPRKFNARARKHLRRATELNGRVARRAILSKIRKGGFAKNRPLTVAIKGSSKPLVDKGHTLFQAITVKVVDDFQVFIGILKTDRNYNVGRLLHNGGRIKVTDKMRNLFYLLWLASEGWISARQTLRGRAMELWQRMPGGWKPLSPSLQYIVIPRRAFISSALRSAEFRRKTQSNWSKAYAMALRVQARG